LDLSNFISDSLLYDRQFMIMHGSAPLTQKSFPALCLLQPEIYLETKSMKLSFEDHEPIVVPILDEGFNVKQFQVCTGKVCGDIVEAIDHGQGVSE